jgi:hypothetical protein
MRYYMDVSIDLWLMVSWLNENGSLLKKLILFVIEIVHLVELKCSSLYYWGWFKI